MFTAANIRTEVSHHTKTLNFSFCHVPPLLVYIHTCLRSYKHFSNIPFTHTHSISHLVYRLLQENMEPEKLLVQDKYLKDKLQQETAPKKKQQGKKNHTLKESHRNTKL